ncbi:MAG: 4-(cytidine 5'-diphospho)-2-C-methyl-D-erythritol kinase [Endomicrobia bacterium]|jgi:4-diphosphocytidyl-2-C-methyl-D-erythritol kinase|nr:4-(cytidine 5'-diphospho)-2-C-methyl-D-erythritol kinase [Endomicrobiia bacterium]
MKITFKAPAKINLYLEITGKRPDGYHNLESIMQTVSLYDEITVEDAPGGINLECDNKNLPSNSSNIVYKAAEAVRNRFNIQKGVKITLKKEIPTGAGLGGGSSDAAAAIKALVKLWNIKTQKTELEQIAAKLGADVAFFLTGGTALCEGTGEIVTPLLSIRKMPVVLANPGFGVLTASIYKKVTFPLTNPRKIHTIKKLICDGSFNENYALKYCFNRLEEFVFPDYSEIAKIKSVMADLGCASLMSGSGATVFGIFGSESQSETIQSKLREYQWNVWTVFPVD